MNPGNRPIYRYMQQYHVTSAEVWQFRAEPEATITAKRAKELAAQHGLDYMHIADVLWCVYCCRHEASYARAKAQMYRWEKEV